MDAFERAVAEASWLSDGGAISPRYAATVRLGRALAKHLDEIEGSCWENSAGKPDTATASQYLKVLDALNLTPSSSKRAGKASGDDIQSRQKRQSSLARFTGTGKNLKVVGE